LYTIRNETAGAAARVLPEEVAVAVSYDRVSFAVMMATPADLEDFAIGFSLTEGIVGAACEITALDVVEVAGGVECRMALAPGRRAALEARRRRLAGPVGCGLCGIDSLAEVARAVPPVAAGGQVRAGAIAEGFAAMAGLQTLNRQTHGVHAAGLLNPATGAVLVREDVGRHNALDKMIGAAARAGLRGADGVVLLTSRVSIEMIQKAGMFGAPVVAAISVPTARAARAAAAAGITLIGVARADGFEVFTHAARVVA
jgi:FdhD protein